MYQFEIWSLTEKLKFEPFDPDLIVGVTWLNKLCNHVPQGIQIPTKFIQTKNCDLLKDFEIFLYMQDKLSFLCPQIEVYKNYRWLLQIEHHQLELELAVREKELILQEVEMSHFSFFIFRI